MHIMIAVFTILAALATWYMRLRAIGSMARDAGKAANRVRQMPRKFAFLSRSSKAGLKAVDDPMEAASILMVLMAGGHGGQTMNSDLVHLMEAQACTTFELDKADSKDLMTHAIWMVKDVDLVSGVVLRMTQVVKQSPGVGPAELVDLYEILEAISLANGAPSLEQKRILDLYRGKVGLSA